MTEQDLLLVGGLAGAALGVTLVDLLWSGWRHRRRIAQLRASETQGAGDGVETRPSELWGRLAAIEAADE